MLELEYPYTLIYLITCLHLLTLRPQTAIDSEKPTIFTFSDRKAKVTMTLP